MCRVVVVSLCGVLSVPAAGWAQPAAPPNPLPPAAYARAALPTEVGVEQPPAPVPSVVDPALGDPPASAVSPVIVEGKEKKPLVTKRAVGQTLGGVAGGVAGAILLGPIGKIAGSFIGKQLTKKAMGKKDRAAAEADVAAAPSPEAAATPAATTASDPATLPPPAEPVLVSESAPAAGPSSLDEPNAPDPQPPSESPAPG